jgi:hypothetical protein
MLQIGLEVEGCFSVKGSACLAENFSLPGLVIYDQCARSLFGPSLQTLTVIVFQHNVWYTTSLDIF